MIGQANEILEDLSRLTRCFDFTHERLADDVAEATAVGIFEYMDAETGPDNNRWVELSESYAEWKSKHYPGEPMAVLLGHMKDPVQLKGTLDATPTRLVQTYGIDEEAKTLAEWFTEGNEEQNRPARPFYALNDLAVELVNRVFDARFDSVV